MMMRFLRNESGATAIEYGMIAMIISLAIIGGMSTIADQVELLFDDVGETITQALQ